MKVAEPQIPSYGQKTILYVDPDIPSFLIVRSILGGFQVELIHARSGTDAIRLLREKPGTDGIITEIRVPELDGFGILREARILNPGIPVVALTASVFNDIEQKCRIAGFSEYISKPLNITTFIKKMENLGLTGPPKKDHNE